MKKTKLNPILLSEELKRFKMLNEYSFYTEKDTSEYEKPLILGTDLEEADGEEKDIEGDVNDIENELGLSDETPPNTGGDMGGDMGADMGGDMGADMGADMGGDMGADMGAEPELPAEDEVEIDVTSIVKSSEEAKNAAEEAKIAANNIGQDLMKKLSNLEVSLSKMDSMTAKIDGLEQEIIKRNPTPVEKLEMRSLSSYPYSQKLTDYWAEKEGPYDVMNQEQKEKEYILTKDEVDSTYSDSQVKNSFDVDFEEEDIY